MGFVGGRHVLLRIRRFSAWVAWNRMHQPPLEENFVSR
jgi:hypothetical protein